MAYLTIARIDGDPEQLLDRYQETAEVMAAAGRDHGLIVHAAAKTGDGLMIVNLWPSEDRSHAAARDARRHEVIKRHGLDPSRIRYEHHAVAGYELFA